ncbi:X-Pro aminopeptidase [Flavobacterium aquidurense]|uniref:aminopeptidase P family protein n=1 Tax=Flavobacterium aquidurense TaxID=362413 RepID=UPI00091A999A|nr:aminopeptidase P family protein [Flavobacterium aquidurense]OXA66473.1 X-Pro aminopeptidase [Flavobacterium aquidurense]SHH74725.1 Xaa-Pro aminopeptidase [Flavobacterium frigidimaris]
MRYDSIPVSLFENNRKRFIAKMQNNSLAILTSNDVMPNNADDVMGFAQNNDLFYLSGIEQDETILVLYPDAFKEENRAILFVKEVSEQTLIWDGDFLSKEKVSAISGIKNVKWIHEFEKTIQLFAFEADTIYLGHNEHIKRITSEMNTRQDRMIQWCKQKYPLHHYERVAKITRDLRPIKSDEEVDLIRKAISISVKGFKGLLKAVKPEVKEYELEAELAYQYIKNGGNRHAFKPIVASGKNACALHYNTNDSVCKDGEMILVDFGVCYANYNSDITRCLPVNGKFSARQREVYESVLYCLKEGSKFLKPGVLSKDYELQMANLIEAELVKLKLITLEEIASQDPEKPAYKKYFMHGTAHYLGLDVHDVGLYSKPFEKGMVLTCEPGIYIREEGIGCRLENDYLLTENGNINLSEEIPIEIIEIEQLINT